jgi:Rad3-related DNA helicase
MQGKKNALQSSHNTRQSKRQSKDKLLVINYIKSKVEKGTGLTFQELKKQYKEDELFNVALKHVTTTKKALCTAMEIPVEAGCRYKRKLEKSGLLMQSIDEVICPYTKHLAHLISTNPDEFQKLRQTNQLILF